MKKQTGKHYPSIKDATDAIILWDFDRVIEYRIIYNRKTETEPEYWTVKRKIMSYNAFGKAKWVTFTE
jgi:hypothetical protein